MSTQQYNVRLLTVCQALTMTIPAFVVFVGSIVGGDLAPAPAYATLPVALFMLGSAGATLPIILAMQHWRRKKLFIGVAGLACLGIVLAMVALVRKDFALYCTGLALMGVGLAAGQQYRFAAMESVPVDDMPKAASRVMLGGLVAAFMGPELAVRGAQLLPAAYLGSFFLLLILAVAAMAVLFWYREPDRERSIQAGSARPLSIVLRQPAVLAAIAAGAAGFAVMSLVMTATPLHMHVVNGHSLVATKWVLQSHIAAMFAPSFVVPWLVRRLGIAGLIATGVLAHLLVVAVAFSPASVVNYWIALVLLGIGWNFLFVGGTTLLATSYQPAEAFRVQAVNDLTLFSLQAVGALAAGWLLARFGWQNLLSMALPALALAVLALLNWIWSRRSSPTVNSP